jgi:hypothetical protein
MHPYQVEPDHSSDHHVKIEKLGTIHDLIIQEVVVDSTPISENGFD